MPVKKAKKKITGVEFLDWQMKILQDDEDRQRRKWIERDRSDYFFAQISQGLYLLRKQIVGMLASVSNWPELEVEKFLIGFQMKDQPELGRSNGYQPSPPPQKRIEEMTPEEILAKKKEVSRRSRHSWAICLGLNPERDA